MLPSAHLNAQNDPASNYAERLAARFVDNADGTVTDSTTGLTWIIDPHALSGNLQSHTWDEAVKFCDKLDFVRHCDWRLPTVTELLSLVENGQIDSALPKAKPFKGVPRSNAYWTSTTFVHKQQQAWIVDLKFGSAEYTQPKSQSIGYVMPIRGRIHQYEQGGAGQSTTTHKLKSEGNNKLQPESKVAPGSGWQAFYVR